MKTITIGELQALLSVNFGNQFVTLTTKTDARLKKGGNELGKVYKVSRVNAAVNFNYSNAVNRQRCREGEYPDFEPEPRKWGVRIPHTPFVTHKGKVYLEAKVERVLFHRYEDEQGRVLADEQVRPFLPKRTDNKEHQGVEREVLVRDYDFASIVTITLRGEDYEIKH